MMEIRCGGPEGDAEHRVRGEGDHGRTASLRKRVLDQHNEVGSLNGDEVGWCRALCVANGVREEEATFPAGGVGNEEFRVADADVGPIEEGTDGRREFFPAVDATVIAQVEAQRERGHGQIVGGAVIQGAKQDHLTAVQ